MKRVPYPVDVNSLIRIAVKAHHVESRAAIAEFCMLRQKEQSCARETLLFMAIHGGRGPANRSAGTTTYFDKNNQIPVAHDEVQLAMTAVEVTRQQGQATAQ